MILNTIRTLKEGIHIEGQVQAQSKRLSVKELCGEEKVRNRVRERVSEEEEGEDKGVEEEKEEGEEIGKEEETREGDLECAIAIVKAFEYYLHLLTSKCTMCTLHISQALHHNFKETLDTIKGVMDGIYETVSSIAGKTSMLIARMQERAAEASFSCLLSMQSCSSTCGTISI